MIVPVVGSLAQIWVDGRYKPVANDEDEDDEVDKDDGGPLVPKLDPNPVGSCAPLPESITGTSAGTLA